MQTTAYFVTALVGALLAVQVGLNAIMRTHLGSAAAAAAVNFAVGLVALVLVVLVTRVPLPGPAQFSAAPWWAWLAGLAGAAYVASSAVAGPLIGGAGFVAAVIAGQMLASLALDHFGVLGFPTRPIDAARVIGALMVVGGVLLLARD